MTTTKTCRRVATTAAMLVAFLLSGVLGAAAETDIYKDVLMPNGKARSMAAKLADIRACGGSKGVTPQEFPAVNDCMHAHG
jgi:hypothetical protein